MTICFGVTSTGSDERTDLRLFPLPACVQRGSKTTKSKTPLGLFAAARHALPSQVAALGLGVIEDTPTGRARQVASRRCGIAIISSPTGSRAGTKGPRVGADSRRPSGACNEPRDDLSPAHSHAPGPSESSARAFPSMRFLNPRSRGRTRTLIIYGGSGRSLRPVSGIVDDPVTPRVVCTARLARARAPRTFRAVLAWPDHFVSRHPVGAETERGGALQ